MIDDSDGFVYVVLDPVDLSLFTSPTVSAWTHIDSTGYEAKDAIRVWAECSGGATVDSVNGVPDDEAQHEEVHHQDRRMPWLKQQERAGGNDPEQRAHDQDRFAPAQPIRKPVMAYCLDTPFTTTSLLFSLRSLANS